MKLKELQIKQHSDYPNEFNVYLGDEYIGDLRYTVVLDRFIFESIYPVLFGNTKTFVSIDEFKHRFESDTPNHLQIISNQIDKFVENYKEVHIPLCSFYKSDKGEYILTSQFFISPDTWMMSDVKIVKHKNYIELSYSECFLETTNCSIHTLYNSNIKEIDIDDLNNSIHYDKSKIYTKKLDRILNKLTLGYWYITQYIPSDTQCKWSLISNSSEKVISFKLNNQQF